MGVCHMMKNQLRMQKKSQRNMLSFEERKRLDHALQQQLFETPEYAACSHLLTYVSFGSEADTRNIIYRAIEDQKAVYIPKVWDKSMDFFRIQDLEGLTPSKFGVPEPEYLEENRFCGIPKAEASSCFLLMLLPGLVFDLNGNRIGYGAGYYDRYLSRYPENFFYKMALAYDFQITEAISSDAYDQKVRDIITPSGRIRCDF